MTDIIICLSIIILLFNSASYTLALNKDGKVNTNYLSKDTCYTIKGFSAISIVFSHIAIYGISDSRLIVVYTYVAFLFVALFFFISGYGVMENLSKSPNYLNSFFKKRLFGLLIPYILILGIYFLFDSLTGKKYSVVDILVSLVNGNPTADHSWYIIAIFFFYILFYIAAKTITNKKVLSLSIFFVTVVNIIILYLLGYPRHWFLSSLAFPTEIKYVKGVFCEIAQFVDGIKS